MKIDDINFKIDFCCYQMYDHIFYYGVKEDWEYCPYCGKDFEFESEHKDKNYEVPNDLYSV